ncbi:unnamed protein product [Heligmosomoides polygyrus]|uniref:Transposase n=1 Tax=Heligmosomoides polygyrus TaxID=6339 RepID=A0A183GDG1_HELPZ|nr:unnamed protein product [Heligmosomoides polygyrus]
MVHLGRAQFPIALHENGSHAFAKVKLPSRFILSGRESDDDNYRLRQLVESDSRRTTLEFAQDLGMHYATIARELPGLGKVQMLAQWVPMTSPNAIASDDEESGACAWVDKGQQPEPQPKEGPHPSKIMLSVWLDYKGVIFYKLRARNETLTADFFCQQLYRLAPKIAESV